jgi:hypothetical protein
MRRLRYKELVHQLVVDYPEVTFKSDTMFYWSPTSKTVHYRETEQKPTDIWSLLHEVSHGILNHTTYYSDVELLLLETEAWDKAKEIGLKCGLVNDEAYIQDCLDSYRDWLYRRSICPRCEVSALQIRTTLYECHNCAHRWKVSKSRMCRPYRKSLV